MLSLYQGRTVKTLFYAVLKYQLPGLQIIDSRLINGKKTAALNEWGEVKINYPAKDNLKYIPVTPLLEGKIKADALQNKTVIVGYDGIKIGVLNTPIGNIKTHRMFIYAVYDLYNQLAE